MVITIILTKLLVKRSQKTVVPSSMISYKEREVVPYQPVPMPSPRSVSKTSPSFCPMCGNKIEKETFQFCSNCGYELME